MRGGIALVAAMVVATTVVAGATTATASGGPGEAGPRMLAGGTVPGDGPEDGAVGVPASAGRADPRNGTTTDSGAPNPSAVKLVARYPADDGYRNATLVTGEEFLAVGEVDSGFGGPFVAVRLTEEGARQFADRIRETGITTEGIDDCRWEVREGYCLLAVSRGEVVYAAGLTAGLANQINRGSFVGEPVFRFTAENESEARAVRAALLGRAPPTETTATAGSGNGPTGPLPFESVPAPVILAGSGVIVVFSALVLFGRESDEADEGEVDGSRDAWGSPNDDPDR